MILSAQIGSGSVVYKMIFILNVVRLNTYIIIFYGLIADVKFELLIYSSISLYLFFVVVKLALEL